LTSAIGGERAKESVGERPDAHRERQPASAREGVSLKEHCPYCSQPLTTYPLIMSDAAAQTVYHAACAVELATDILVDLFTFLSPPPPYERLFVLTAPDAAPSQQTTVESG
jgi:hypothetical protein